MGVAWIPDQAVHPEETSGNHGQPPGHPIWLTLAHEKPAAAVLAPYEWDPSISHEEILEC
jgi:hypothetical protein